MSDQAPGMFTPVVNSLKFLIRRQSKIDNDRRIHFRIVGKVEMDIFDKEGNLIEIREFDTGILEKMLNT